MHTLPLEPPATIRLRIDHQTRYDFERPVEFAPHFVRLFPRTEPGRLVQRVHFKTNADADVQYRRDVFDNCIARCSYPSATAQLFFDYSLELELHEQNPYHFLLDYDAANYPFQYRPNLAARLAAPLVPPAGESAQTATAPLLPMPFWQAPTAPVMTVTLLIELLDAVNKNIGYDRREEGEARPPGETLRLGHGSCRDVAVLLAAILRELGFAARLASGYLCEFGEATERRRAVGAMHLWTDVFLPGAGWVGLDATNNRFCNHEFITTAVGLTSAEVTPISGSYLGGQLVPGTMNATIELTKLRN